jgi:hypothetical protein
MERHAMRPTFGVAVIAALGAAYFSSTDAAHHEARPRRAERAAQSTSSGTVVSVVLPAVSSVPDPPGLGLERGRPRR